MRAPAWVLSDKAPCRKFEYPGSLHRRRARCEDWIRAAKDTRPAPPPPARLRPEPDLVRARGHGLRAPDLDADARPHPGPLAAGNPDACSYARSPPPGASSAAAGASGSALAARWPWSPLITAASSLHRLAPGWPAPTAPRSGRTTNAGGTPPTRRASRATGRSGPAAPTGPHDLSRLAGKSCIRRVRPRVIPGHKAVVLCRRHHIASLGSWADFAYLARLMQFPRVQVDLRRGDLLVAKPEGYDGDVVAGWEQAHRGVPQGVAGPSSSHPLRGMKPLPMRQPPQKRQVALAWSAVASQRANEAQHRHLLPRVETSCFAKRPELAVCRICLLTAFHMMFTRRRRVTLIELLEPSPAKDRK